MPVVITRPCLALLASIAAAPASAEIAGNAVAVTPSAQTESPRGAVILAKGSEINAFDKVRTSVDGAVTLRFRDNSSLDVGPGSVVSIDRFVYNPDNTAKTAAITLTRGTFRWVSGRSAKEAYNIKTPASTIGIRGTDFTVIADLGATVVQLKSGAVRACSPVSGRCSAIERPGQGLRIWNNGRIELFNPGTLLHAQVTRMAHHMRMPGMHRPPMLPGQPFPGAAQPVPAGGQAATAVQQQAAPAGKQQWTGSYAPRSGLASLPRTLSALPGAPPSGPFAAQNGAVMRDHRDLMKRPVLGGLTPGGPPMNAMQMLRPVQRPSAIESKDSANIPVIQ